MCYSNWQLNRLRDALQAYHLYEHVNDSSYYNPIDIIEDEDRREKHKEKQKKAKEKIKRYFTWFDVREAIIEYTGVEVGKNQRGEHIRKFVEGSGYTDEGRKKFPTMKDMWLDAIRDFVTHEDIDLLSMDEINESIPGYQAPMRLLDYLDQDFDGGRNIPVERLQGRYLAQLIDDDEFIVRELTLQRPSVKGLIQVIETENSFDKGMACQFEEMTLEDRRKMRASQIKHSGWAILTPEDNLLFFLKSESSYLNRYYFTLALDLLAWQDSPMTQIYLLHHDFPLEIEEHEKQAGQQQNAGKVSSEMTKNILLYHRIL